jgi:catechol 2,3-dioxygenase-like lactoylglutathione lyase family enzyme
MASRKTPAGRGRAKPKKTARKPTRPRAKAVRRPPSRSPKAARKLVARALPETLRLRSVSPSLTVDDIARSVHFYTEALGFFIHQSWADGSMLRGVMLKAGTCELGLSQDDWAQGRERKKGMGFRLWCETQQDVDALAARVKSKGYALSAEPKDDKAWGVRSFSLDDPDGYHITIARDL